MQNAVHRWNPADYARHSKGQERWAKELFRLLALQPQESVLDIGCGDGRISAGILPAGRYAVLEYTGTYEGEGVFKANVAMMEWAKEKDIVWQISTKDKVEWWGARMEIYLTDPASEPDPNKWQTELAFLVA